MAPRASVRLRSRLTLGAVGLAGLLALLALLQYRWAGELSEAEFNRLRGSAQARANEFAHQFDREITRIYLWFAVSPGEAKQSDWTGVSQSYERWRSRAPQPDSVKGVYLILSRKEGPPSQFALNPSTGRVEGAPWPSPLSSLSARLGQELKNPRPGSRDRLGAGGDLIDEDAPAVVIPILDVEFAPDGHVVRKAVAPQLLGYTVVLLDATYIHDGWLPALERRYFDQADGFDYCLQVFSSPDSTAPIYTSADAGAHPSSPDASVRILDVRFDPRDRDLLEGANPALAGLWGRLFGLDDHPSDARRRPRPPRTFEGEGRGRWRVALWNRAGGLATVVSVARRRNLAVSFGILILLGTSVALLVTAARRAERLARQQMEFVAGVTHELRTPLAVIRSAAENLADGLVGDVSKVRSYGALVRDEGRRLSEMVEEVLELAGAGSDRPQASPKPLRVDELVDAALRSCADALRSSGVRVERDVPRGLPCVPGDETALRRVLRNLVDNAVKYGADGRWIGIKAKAVRAGKGPEVWVTVEDRGLGISPEDLPRIFEPFYRGSEGVSRSIRGSGLGLSLVRRIVESHGGSITVEARERGSAFTVRLPASAEPAPEGSSESGVNAEAHPAH